MNMQATFINEDGSETTYQGEQAWAMIQARGNLYAGVPKMPPLIPLVPKKRGAKGYNGPPMLTQLPSGKESYRSKNGAGGRKAMFTQSRDYKAGDALGIPISNAIIHEYWLLVRCQEARAELEQAIAKGA